MTRCIVINDSNSESVPLQELWHGSRRLHEVIRVTISVSFDRTGTTLIRKSHLSLTSLPRLPISILHGLVLLHL